MEVSQPPFNYRVQVKDRLYHTIALFTHIWQVNLLLAQRDKAAGGGGGSAQSGNTTGAAGGSRWWWPTINILEGSSIQGSPDYDPDELTVAAGSDVTVMNQDTLPHTVTSGTGPQDPTSAQTFDTNLINVENQPLYHLHKWLQVNMTITAWCIRIWRANWLFSERKLIEYAITQSSLFYYPLGAFFTDIYWRLCKRRLVLVSVVRIGPYAAGVFTSRRFYYRIFS